MKKYLALAYLFFSVISLAQFKDNVFDKESNTTQKESSNVYDSGSEQSSEENSQSFGPGNPGEPAPIDDYIPYLLMGSMILIYAHRKKLNLISK